MWKARPSAALRAASELAHLALASPALPSWVIPVRFPDPLFPDHAAAPPPPPPTPGCRVSRLIYLYFLQVQLLPRCLHLTSRRMPFVPYMGRGHWASCCPAAMLPSCYLFHSWWKKMQSGMAITGSEKIRLCLWSCLTQCASCWDVS